MREVWWSKETSSCGKIGNLHHNECILQVIAREGFIWNAREDSSRFGHFFNVHFSITVEVISIKLVKSWDGETTRIKQHELEIFVADVAADRGLFRNAGRRSDPYLHADGSCGYAASPVGGNRPSRAHARRSHACLAGAEQTSGNRNGSRPPRPCFLVWRQVQRPPHGQWRAL